MAAYRQSLGRWGEDVAAEYLSRQGYTLIERNLRTPYGEIDIVAQKDALLVFVEVKTRATQRYGLPETAITPHKQQHIIAAAQAYLQTNPHPGFDWRIDVIAIQKLPHFDEPEIVHFKNAIA
jgi:putative endonuclease